MPTVNSFTMSPSITQITAYVVVLLGILVFYICITPNMNNTAVNISLSIFYGVSTILLIIFGTISSYVDPSDTVIEEYHRSIKQGIPFNSNNYYYCGTCQSYCHESSKHCRTCKRCVSGFDHHCIWINNCIGGSNYKYFMGMIILVFIKLGFFIATAIYLSLQRNFMQYLASMIVVWIYTLIAAVLGFLNLNLLILHIYLNIKGITTFQFLSIQKEQQKQKRRKQQIEQFRRQAEDSRHDLNKKQNISQIQKNQKKEKKAKRPKSQKSQKSQKSTIEDKGIINSKKDKSQFKGKTQQYQQQNQLPLQKIDILEKIPQDKSEGDISIVDQKAPKLEYKKINLSKFITGNKSMQFIVNASLIDIEQPRYIKTAISERR